jgi:hypothetical protein
VPIWNPVKKCTTYSVQTVSSSANMIAITRADRPVGAGSRSLIGHSYGAPKFALKCPQVPEPSLVRR